MQRSGQKLSRKARCDLLLRKGSAGHRNAGQHLDLNALLLCHRSKHGKKRPRLSGRGVHAIAARRKQAFCDRPPKRVKIFGRFIEVVHRDRRTVHRGNCFRKRMQCALKIQSVGGLDVRPCFHGHGGLNGKRYDRDFHARSPFLPSSPRSRAPPGINASSSVLNIRSAMTSAP